MKRKYIPNIILILVVLVFCVPVGADELKKELVNLLVVYPGNVLLEGDIEVNDMIQLYSRIYRSVDNSISDHLLIEAFAENNVNITLNYNIYAESLNIERYIPDFDYQGRDIEIKALYAVVSNETHEVRSNFVYTDCSLDTNVVNQYWCSLAGSTACGTAAGVIAMQMSYPVTGDELFTRVNEMRKYSLLGEEFSTGPSGYFLSGDHINHTVNKYITEELLDTMVMIDHRTPSKSIEKTLIELLTTGRPAVIEVCYLLGNVTLDFQGISHWITINGFTLGPDGYTFRYADPITVSYRSITSADLETSNGNVSYGDSGYIPVGYIGAFANPLFSIE